MTVKIKKKKKIQANIAENTNEKSKISPDEKLGFSFKSADNYQDNEKLSNQEIYNNDQLDIDAIRTVRKAQRRSRLLAFVFLCMISFSVTGAKFISGTSGSSGATIAKFQINVVGVAGTSPAGVTVVPSAQSSIPDPGNNAENLSVSFGETSAGNAEQNITFTVSNQSDVKIKIANIVWESANAQNLRHNVVPTFDTNEIGFNSSKTFSLTIKKFDGTLPSSYNGILPESGTLTVYIEQID